MSLFCNEFDRKLVELGAAEEDIQDLRLAYWAMTNEKTASVMRKLIRYQEIADELGLSLSDIVDVTMKSQIQQLSPSPGASRLMKDLKDLEARLLKLADFDKAVES